MSENSYDIAVIGGGPAGYVGSIRAAQLGMKVACIDRRKMLGGTCLNVGCIPSKALLESSYKFFDAKQNFKRHGIKVGTVEIDLKDLHLRKTGIVDTLAKGIDFLYKKNHVHRLCGTGLLLGDGKIKVGSKTITAKHILLATGSKSTTVSSIPIDENHVVSSTGALSFTDIPKHLIVIGGGAIGLELGSVWKRLGSKVTVIEYADTICPTLDTDVIKYFTRSLKKQGLAFHLKKKVIDVQKTPEGMVVKAIDRKNNAEKAFTGDKVLVCVGRKPYVDGLGCERLGIARNPQGAIVVDKNFQTSVAHIYAVGDIIPGPMLAHKAEEEACACVEKLAGIQTNINYDAIPNVIYTHPEVACVGKTEAEVIAMGVDYRIYKFPFSANSRSHTNDDTEGFVKLIAEKNSYRLLGAHIVGADAGTLVHEAVIVLQYAGTTEDLWRCCHAHPTLNEAIKEAALGVHGHAIHI